MRVLNAIIALTLAAATYALKMPTDWSLYSENLSSELEVKLSIALKPKDGNKLEKSLIDIATPGTASFRRYLRKDEITAIVGRTDSELQRITEWLAKAGAKVSSVHPHRDWVTVTAKVSAIETLFSCKLASYIDNITKRTRIAASGDYSIPSEVSDLIEMVSGMNTLPSRHWDAKPVSSEELQLGTALAVTPDTIYDLYRSDSRGSHGTKLGSQAVIEFGHFANFNDADLQTFFKQYQPALKGETCGVVEGSNNGNIKPSVEANLDVQYMMAAGVFVNTTDYKIDDSNDIEDEFLAYTQLVNSQYQPPLVHSISYGKYGGSYNNESDQRFSYELQKMGISGISVLLASGDNGVGCNTAGTWQEFDYPSSPYITMVGATYYDSASKTEIGATLSSGGFSADFSEPAWQHDAVSAYFQSGAKMPHEKWVVGGRAYPDMAAFGQNVQVIASGKVQGVSGTSCSAPIFGGLVALINHELMSAGKAPLGFLNPWMYANPQMFTDVTEGSNPYEKCDGFVAAKGWDPVTGLGTPLYDAMLQAAFAATEIKK